MNDIAKRLRIKANVISMGEKISWGSDTALMDEAADIIEALETELIEERESYEDQLQRMKCCGNCQHYTNEKCVTCKRSWANMIEDNWQLKQSGDYNE